jgi:hypothetical protein
MAASNRRTIEAVGRVETFGLPRVEVASGVGALRTLPAARWAGARPLAYV